MTRRTQRRIAWLVILASAAYLLGWAAVTIQHGRDAEMAKSIKGLRADAEKAIAAKDYASADATCAKLQKLKGGAVWAHALRGQSFELQGKISEAKEEYRAAYALGDIVAGGSLAYLNKRGG